MIARGGVASVTHRAVTEAAGLPLATVGYFYSAIDDLIADTFTVFTARRVQQHEELIKVFQSARMTADDIAKMTTKSVAPSLAFSAAMLEAYLPIVRQAAIGAVLRSVWIVMANPVGRVSSW
ncbi:hypothetical protein BKG83_16215 [Mycobacteroides chelonae]|nr:hypothetical protein BKG83_16215 [Mycobacteroides chelonae]